jgi:hypothetical protein
LHACRARGEFSSSRVQFDSRRGKGHQSKRRRRREREEREEREEAKRKGAYVAAGIQRKVGEEMAEREEITGEIARENPKMKGERSEKIEPKRSESITRREGMRGREGGGEGEGRGRRGGGGGERRTGGREGGGEEGGERGVEESRGSRGRSRGKKGVNDGTLVRRGQADTMGVLVRGHDKVGAYVWMFVWMFGCLGVWVWVDGEQKSRRAQERSSGR